MIVVGRKHTVVRKRGDHDDFVMPATRPGGRKKRLDSGERVSLHNYIDGIREEYVREARTADTPTINIWRQEGVVQQKT